MRVVDGAERGKDRVDDFTLSVGLSPVVSPEEAVDEEAEKLYLQFYVSTPAGPSLCQVLQDPEKRRKLGKFIHSPHE